MYCRAYDLNTPKEVRVVEVDNLVTGLQVSSPVDVGSPNTRCNIRSLGIFFPSPTHEQTEYLAQSDVWNQLHYPNSCRRVQSFPSFVLWKSRGGMWMYTV